MLLPVHKVTFTTRIEGISLQEYQGWERSVRVVFWEKYTQALIAADEQVKPIGVGILSVRGDDEGIDVFTYVDYDGEL